MTIPYPVRERVQASLQSRSSRGMLRELKDGSTSLVDFSSNDYLSFSQSTALRERLVASLSSHGVYGPASSRLLDGNTKIHEECEGLLEEFFDSPWKPSKSEGGETAGRSALLFNSGHAANVSIFSVLPSSNSYVIYDSLIHASVHDGMRASRVPSSRRIPFAHNDFKSLSSILRSLPPLKDDEDIWIVVEALYSMDGDWGDLSELCRIVKDFGQQKIVLVVDEAHSTGVCGKGKGLTCELGLQQHFLIRLHTFGKAISTVGAVVILPPLLKDFLVNYARPLIYSTSLPYMNVLAIREAILHLQTTEGQLLISSLISLSQYTTTLLSSFLPPSSSQENTLLSIPHTKKPSQIIPILTPHPIALSKYLKTKGFLCRPIRYPTVPKGGERVRVCLHAMNTKHQVEGLAKELKKWMGDMQIQLETSRPELTKENKTGMRDEEVEFPMAKL
ncbi:PLP-dependent transferase [Atractiella rhizophila]|nr:PLP-dependent transferase [Atractiella rhizophila]